MRNKSFSIYFTLAFTLLSMFFYMVLDIAPSYFINDDIFLKQISSGEMTGTPTAHLLHIGFLTGSLLKLLYTILPAIPGYGILLFFYYSISLITTFHVFVRLIHKISYKLVFTGLYLFVSISFLWIHMIQIQYTTITAILCAASLVHFYLSPDISVPKLYIKQNIISIIFFLLSIELRNKACLMFLPTFLLIGIAKLIRNKTMFISISAYGSILLSVLLI